MHFPLKSPAPSPALAVPGSLTLVPTPGGVGHGASARHPPGPGTLGCLRGLGTPLSFGSGQVLGWRGSRQPLPRACFVLVKMCLMGTHRSLLKL